MRILWVNEHATPTGGCERYLLEVVEMLRSRGVRSTLMYNVASETDHRMLKQFDGAFPQVDLPRQIQEIAPDLIYAHRIDGIEPVRQLTSAHAPALRFIHDHKLFCLREHKYHTIGHRTCTRKVGLGCYPCLGFVNRSHRWPGVRFARAGALLKEQRVNMGFNGLVVGSKYMAEHLALHGFSHDRVHVNPLFAKPVTPNPNIRRESGQLLFAGQLARGKGLDVLLHALPHTQTPNRLLIIGSGRQEQEFRGLCKSLGLDDRVTFAAKMDPDRLAEAYQRAACVVFPSRTPETFGLVGPEAMRFGTPVVATNVGGTGEWLLNGKTGLAVPSNDPQALAVAIDQILDNPQLAKNLGAAGREHYESRFRPEHHVERLYTLFQKTIAVGNTYE